LVDLIEDDDIGTVEGLKLTEERVVGRVSVDLVRQADAFEQVKQDLETTVMVPAVDVLRADAECLFFELRRSITGETGLARARWPFQKGVSGHLAVDDRFEGVPQLVLFGVAVDHVTGHPVGV
jgi:hypothetical protein